MSLPSGNTLEDLSTDEIYVRGTTPLVLAEDEAHSFEEEKLFQAYSMVCLNGKRQRKH